MSDEAKIIRIEPDQLAEPQNPLDGLAHAMEVVKFMAAKCETPEYIAEIQGRRFPTVNWWTTVGASLGIIAREVSNDPIEKDGKIHGYEAVTELWRNGMLVGRGSAICTRDERSWARRDEYAMRSMAATRATGKAFRIGFSFLAVMAGLEATPAEEVPRAGFGAGTAQAAPETLSGTMTVLVHTVREKSGTSKDGKEWNGWILECDHDIVDENGESPDLWTFSYNDAQAAMRAVEHGKPAAISWRFAKRRAGGYALKVEKIVCDADIDMGIA